MSNDVTLICFYTASPVPDVRGGIHNLADVIGDCCRLYGVFSFAVFTVWYVEKPAILIIVQIFFYLSADV